MRNYVILTCDENTLDDDGEPLDLYGYLQNELDNDRITCGISGVTVDTEVAGALFMLRTARDILAKHGATKALERVRYAIKSAEGADRHAALKARRKSAKKVEPRQNIRITF